MKKVKIPLKDIIEWSKNPVGRSICFPVCVGWKELQLTESQILENAIAYAKNKQPPHQDNSIFLIEVTAPGGVEE